MLLALQVDISYIMQDFCHGSQANVRFMYSVNLLLVKMERAVFICDVRVRVVWYLKCFVFVHSEYIQHSQLIFIFLPARCCKKRDHDLGSR